MPVPSIDDGVRRRLTARFGEDVGRWFDALPGVLSALAERWQIEFGSLIPRGSTSVVIRCYASGARPAVLKVSPDQARLANEAAALDRWTTVQHGVPDTSYPSVAHRVAYLFDSGTRPYERHPELVEVIAPELYERGRRLATRLADDASPTTLLHGDLNPGNILGGGPQRGLVAIDPAPCLGDAAFDA
jgi:streptomycin 6-kinase